MTESEITVEKLERIKQLWLELGRTKTSAPDYETIMNKIRLRSAEYQSLVDRPTNAKKTE